MNDLIVYWFYVLLFVFVGIIICYAIPYMISRLTTPVSRCQFKASLWLLCSGILGLTSIRFLVASRPFAFRALDPEFYTLFSGMAAMGCVITLYMAWRTLLPLWRYFEQLLPR